MTDLHPRLEALKKQAQEGGREVHIDNTVTVRRYFASANGLLKQGKTYQAEMDLERAYVLKWRFAIFFLERLPEHKDAYSAVMKPDLKRLKAAVKVVMEELGGDLKTMLEAKYRAEDAAEAERQAMLTAEQVLQAAQTARAASVPAQAPMEIRAHQIGTVADAVCGECEPEDGSQPVVAPTDVMGAYPCGDKVDLAVPIYPRCRPATAHPPVPPTTGPRSVGSRGVGIWDGEDGQSSLSSYNAVVSSGPHQALFSGSVHPGRTPPPALPPTQRTNIEALTAARALNPQHLPSRQPPSFQPTGTLADPGKPPAVSAPAGVAGATCAGPASPVLGGSLLSSLLPTTSTLGSLGAQSLLPRPALIPALPAGGSGFAPLPTSPPLDLPPLLPAAQRSAGAHLAPAGGTLTGSGGAVGGLGNSLAAINLMSMGSSAGVSGSSAPMQSTHPLVSGTPLGAGIGSLDLSIPQARP